MSTTNIVREYFVFYNLMIINKKKNAYLWADMRYFTVIISYAKYYVNRH